MTKVKKLLEKDHIGLANIWTDDFVMDRATMETKLLANVLRCNCTVEQGYIYRALISFAEAVIENATSPVKQP